MHSNQSQVDKLVAFKQKDKFSAKAWNDRGLHPSGSEFCQQLTGLFNSCVDNLIAAVKANATGKQLKAVLKQALSTCNKPDYDTEEKEFIGDLFLELAAIIQIDFTSDLNKWLYGPVLATLFKLKNVINPEKIIKTIQHPCTNCGTTLETYVMRKELGIPEYGWYLVKCNNCKELNLLVCGPDIKEIKFGNYEYVETLSKTDYTYEQALVRLEQIKFFRK
jgi:hypothetical protein